MAFNVEKNLTHLFLTGKNSILSPEVWQKKLLSQTKSPILLRPPPPQPPPASKVKWSVPNNPNETSHIPKQLLHYVTCCSYFSRSLDVEDLPFK